MQTIFEFMLQWVGVILCVIFCLIITISAQTSGVTAEEKRLAKDDNPDNYLVKNRGSGIMKGILLVIVAAAVCGLIGYLALKNSEKMQIVVLIIEIAVSVVVGILYFMIARHVLVERVMVTGDEIMIEPAFGKRFKTSFSEIRTVKKNGGQTAAESQSLVIRPNGGKRFTVTSSMTNYDRFAKKIDSDVTLPDLTKKQTVRDYDDDDYYDDEDRNA